MKNKMMLVLGFLIVAAALPVRAASSASSRELRFSLNRPLAGAVQIHADVVYVPKPGDPADYRLSAKLGVVMPLRTEALAMSVAFSDEYNNSRGAWRNEAKGLASLSLRFGSFGGR